MDAEDRRLARLSTHCEALPEASRELMGDHATFSVRGKKFAYFLNSHHGDGIVSVCFKAESDQGAVLLASDPSRFYSPAYIGPRGWLGLRLDVGKVDWAQVREFVTGSYRLAAPVRLVARLDSPQD